LQNNQNQQSNDIKKIQDETIKKVGLMINEMRIAAKSDLKGSINYLKRRLIK